MSSTPNLLISHIASSQNSKEITANSAFDKLDEAMNDSISVALTGTTHTLVQADALANVFFLFTGALSGANTITLPANKRIYLVVNNTTGGFNLIFKAGTGAATVTVTDTGVPHFLYCDGTNTVYEVGSPVSAGALQHPVNAQTGTSYTVLNGDRGKLLTLSNAGAVTVTLPQAGAASAFLAGWFAFVQNKNAGAVTITPTTSTINGATTLVLQKNGSVLIVSDGTNYQVFGVTSPFNLTVADLLAQTAAIGATTLYAVPATGAGLYRLSWAAKITTPASTSSVLGGANGFQSTYTDADDSVVTTPLAVPNALATGNTTGVQLSGVVFVNAKASTNIQYLFDYTSVGGTPMAYSLHIRLEYLG